MARLYLVRHGHAAASFTEARDPGLDATGIAQAEAMAAQLARKGPLSLVTSPLRRARETAAPLERLWRRSSRVEPAAGEIPSPQDDLSARGAWLREIMVARWSGLPPELRAWRQRVGAALMAIAEPTVVVTHFVAINAAVGIATDDDRLVAFKPDHCSVTVLDVEEGELRLVQLGTEAATAVL